MRARIPEAIAADLGRRFGSEAIARGVAAAEEQVAMLVLHVTTELLSCVWLGRKVC